MKIVSGGQTGVDRAALDVAMAMGLPCGGWCPKGRKAEDGILPLRYPLTETPADDYAQRTTWNVRDSDGTLILTRGAPSGGTAQTVDDATGLGKPHLIVDLSRPWTAGRIRSWLTRHRIKTVNVAGPRESKSPGIYAAAAACLVQVLVARKRGGGPCGG